MADKETLKERARRLALKERAQNLEAEPTFGALPTAQSAFPGASDPTSGLFNRERERGFFGNPNLPDDIVRSLASGMTFGTADEIAAGANAALGQGSFDENLAAEAERDAQIDPGLRLGGELTGAILGPGKLAQGLARAPGLRRLPDILKFGLIGAGEGAAFGAGTAEPGDRLQGAQTGATLGAGLGALVPATTSAAAALVGRVRSSALGGDTAKAIEKLRQDLQRDKITTEDVAKKLEEFGPESTILDAGGRNVARRGRAVVTKPGEASDEVTKKLDARQEAQGERLVASINKAIDPTASFRASADELEAAMKTNAKPAYDAAYAKEVPFTPELRSILERPAVKAAWKKAQQIAANEGGAPLPRVFEIDELGNIKIGPEVPDTRTLDLLKRGMDDTIERARDSITGKIVGDAARSVNQARRDLLAEVDKLNPLYPQARSTYAGPARSRQALDDGRRFLRGDSELTAAKVAKLSPADKAFFRAGAAREIRDTIAKTPDGANAVRRIFGNKLQREKMRALFPDQKSFDTFAREMQSEAVFFGRRAFIGNQSATADKAEEVSDLLGAGAGAVQDISSGRPVSALSRLGGAALNRLSRGSDDVANELGRRLVSNNPAENAQTLNLLSRRDLEAVERRRLNALLTAGGASQAN